MHFVIVYPNNPSVRELVQKTVLEAIKQGVNFNFPTRFPQFLTFPRWPSLHELTSLPLFLQCEEVELQDNQLITHRQLVIDAEIIEVSTT